MKEMTNETKGTPRTITVADLVKAYACSDQVRLFEATFPKGVRVTLRNLNRAVKAGLNVAWAVTLLTPEQQAEYEKTTDSAWDEYWKATDSAWAEYKKAIAPAWAKYWEAIASARAEYEKATAPAWAEYGKAIAPARAEYRKAKDSAWAEYEKVRNVALVRALNCKKKSSRVPGKTSRLIVLGVAATALVLGLGVINNAYGAPPTDGVDPYYHAPSPHNSICYKIPACRWILNNRFFF